LNPLLQGLARLRSRWPSPIGAAVTVLGYHRVDVTGGDLAVTPAAFASQMAVLSDLRRDGVPTVDLATARAQIDAGTGPRRSVVLTFDDAWADNHTNALPCLVEHGLPAVLYAPSRLLGQPDYMTCAQLVEMADAGVIIGAHTRTHPDLRRCTEQELDTEVAGSKGDLEDLLGRPVTTFAYPTGLFDERVEAAVERAGFSDAVTTRRGWLRSGTPRFRIPRSFVEEFDERTFGAAAVGGLTALRPVDALRRLIRRP
jgi:peptidoglycan/xylan/chitin deacetylase (PgdA/CDA1 family)